MKRVQRGRIGLWLMGLLVACAGAPEQGLVDCQVPTVDNVVDQRGAYYACLDAALNRGDGCGKSGYPLGYGHKYVERFFLETWFSVSPQGQDFLRDTGLCLQTSMARHVTFDSTCDEVWDLGFDSHPECYLQSGFCQLSIADVAAISAAVDPEDQALPEQQAQVIAIIEGCAR